MDVISLGKANKALKENNQLQENVIGSEAEGTFKTVDHRLDWVEGQSKDIIISNLLKIDLSKGIFTNTEFRNDEISLKKVSESLGGYTENVIPQMISDISPSPIVISASSVKVDSLGYAYKAFDRSTNDWRANGQSGWIQIDFGEKRNIVKYSINVIIGIYNGPRNFILKGSNDLLIWDDLDTRIDIVWNTADLKQDFTFNNKNAYRYYKLDVLNIGLNAGKYSTLQINEIEMMELAKTSMYSSNGIWESDVIDLETGWQKTRLADILKTLPLSTALSINIASSIDGEVFGEYVPLIATTPPQARYNKLKITLSAPEVIPSETKTFIFDQLNKEVEVLLNEFTQADNQLKLKLDHKYSMNKDVAWLETGLLHRNLIKKDQWKTINILTINDIQPFISKTLFLSNGEYIGLEKPQTALDVPKWKVVSTVLPTQAEFELNGIDDLSLLDRGIQAVLDSPFLMTDGDILGTGRIFKKTIDLKKYMELKTLSIK